MESNGEEGTQPIERPVWRSFQPRFIERAVAHVRSGGFAVLLLPRGEMKLLLPRDGDGPAPTEMALWALLALEVRRWGRPRQGPARGLVTVRVQPRHRDIIREWCERDGGCPESTYRMHLDCMACGACCRDNRVVLERHDLARWRRAGRRDLEGRAYVRTARGVVVLRVTEERACVHLGPRNRCSIYDLRPDNCSAFPVGSEACLAARLESLDIVD
jgi:hypothetical protein